MRRCVVHWECREGDGDGVRLHKWMSVSVEDDCAEDAAVLSESRLLEGRASLSARLERRVRCKMQVDIMIDGRRTC